MSKFFTRVAKVAITATTTAVFSLAFFPSVSSASSYPPPLAGGAKQLCSSVGYTDVLTYPQFKCYSVLLDKNTCAYGIKISRELSPFYAGWYIANGYDINKNCWTGGE